MEKCYYCEKEIEEGGGFLEYDELFCSKICVVNFLSENDLEPEGMPNKNEVDTRGSERHAHFMT